jgi:hypothetical protein
LATPFHLAYYLAYYLTYFFLERQFPANGNFTFRNNVPSNDQPILERMHLSYQFGNSLKEILSFTGVNGSSLLLYAHFSLISK